ncbi:hypothetical protein JZ751_028300 [Albula glossodonta]|uniref:Uncharacterized protein n=1 Tax=Albula glossodonta TaxID=121402 RepID=A0A8T2NB31_9TELE|nr:hypothetical protein JZ751_028300 [Albula glossodonta]
MPRRWRGIRPHKPAGRQPATAMAMANSSILNVAPACISSQNLALGVEPQVSATYSQTGHGRFKGSSENLCRAAGPLGAPGADEAYLSGPAAAVNGSLVRNYIVGETFMPPVATWSPNIGRALNRWTSSVELALAEGSEALNQGELSHTSQTGTGQEFPSLLTEELDRDGLRAAGFIPLQNVKEVLLEKQGPLRRFLGSRKQYGKRGNPTECFWKYCV